MLYELAGGTRTGSDELGVLDVANSACVRARCALVPSKFGVGVIVTAN